MVVGREGTFFPEWLLIVLDHYNLCNFQRLYDYKEKKANHRITQSPFENKLALECIPSSNFT